MIWGLQRLHVNQEGFVQNDEGHTRRCMSRMCAQSPLVFCAILQWAMAERRAHPGVAGLDFQDGLPRLLDLRFADDILIFGQAADEATRLLNEMVRCCSQAGLLLNATKTKVLTTDAQPPAKLMTEGGINVGVLPANQTHKWLRCLLGYIC